MYSIQCIIIFIGSLISYCLSLISIPFKSINVNNEGTNSFFSGALSNEIYINLTLSFPSQNSNRNIKSILSIDKKTLYIPEKYLSSSKNINKENWIYTSWANSLLYFGNDSFTFDILSDSEDKKTYKKNSSNNVLNFLTKDEIENNEIYNNYGITGLKLISNENEAKFPDLIKELKREKIINSYSWSINYNYIDGNYYEGEFLIGEQIEKYYKKDLGNDYSEFRMIKASNRKDELYWDIKFKDITIEETSINTINYKNTFQATFNPKLNIIIGTTEFKNAILNQFFNNYIYKRICYEEKIIFSSLDYIGITCKKELNITSFPYISFRLQFYRFTLTYKDLFCEDKNQKDVYHFLIIFQNNLDFDDNNEMWTFGLPFMNKYILIFNSDSKLIQYYLKNNNGNVKPNNVNDDSKDNENENKENEDDNNKSNNSDNINKKNIENKNKNNNDNKNVIFIVIGIILGCSLLILFGMKIQINILKKRFPTLNLNGRKKHKNELSCELEQMNKDNNLLM